jgi:hypothetical protein
VIAVGCLATAKEVPHIVLVNNREDSCPNWRSAYTYSICGSDKVAGARRVFRVSIDSLVPQTIRPKEEVHVVLKVENTGALTVLLPISGDPTEDAAAVIHYRANLDLLAGTPAAGPRLGWFELYGSSLRPDTLVTLSPGNWVTIEGEVRSDHWFLKPTNATAQAALQLCVRELAGASTVGCVKQDPGRTVSVFYLGIPNGQ